MCKQTKQKQKTALVLSLAIGLSFNAFSQDNTPKDSTKKTIGLSEISIEVKKELNGKSTLKMPVPLKDVPVTVHTVDAEVLSKQGTDDMVGALKNISGINPLLTYGGFQHYIIRGFPEFTLLIDGFRDERHNISNSAPMSNLANVERIEVLKGPASVLYGHSALGGVINVIRKQPTSEPNYDFSASYGSFNSKRMTIDAGGPLTKKLSYRINAGLSDDDGWRNAGSNRTTAYLALNYKATAKDVFDIQVGFSKDLYKLDAGIPTIDGKIPTGVDLSTRYNVKQDHLAYNRLDLQAQYTHKFNNSISITDRIAYATDDIKYFSTETLWLNTTKDTVKRGYFDFNHQTKPLQNNLDVNFNFKTGKIEQKVLVGYSLNILDRHTLWDAALRGKTATSVSLISPDDEQGYVNAFDTRKRNMNEIMHGIYFQDWMKITDRIKTLIGLRYDVIDGKYSTDILPSTVSTASAGVVTSRNSQALTYRVGLVYQPIKLLSVYGSYSTYYKPARQVPSDDMQLKPETGYQGEVGVRIDLSDKLAINVASYYIIKNDVIISLPKGFFDQASSAESKGVEADIQFNPFKNLQIIAGYAYNEAVFKNYTTSASADLTGKYLRNAPNTMANLWANYTISKGFIKGLGFSLGGNYVGASYTDNDNIYVLPEYKVVNAGLFYSFKSARIGLNINNALGEVYVPTVINNTQFYPGTPRNYMVSIRYKI